MRAAALPRQSDEYLDTGLFLDHRPTRALITGRGCGGRFLNLFAYTGTASVYAAAGGAASTTTGGHVVGLPRLGAAATWR